MKCTSELIEFFYYIVSSLFEITSLSRPSSPLASSSIAFSHPGHVGWNSPPSSLVHFLKRDTAYIFKTGLGTIECAVFNYTTDCWHIPRIVASGLTSRIFIVVSLERTVCILGLAFLMYSSLQRPLLGCYTMCERAATSVPATSCNATLVITIVILALLLQLLFPSGSFLCLFGNSLARSLCIGIDAIGTHI